MGAPLGGRRGRGDHVASGRAGRQHRVAGIARGVAVQPEGLDAVVVLVGDVGRRRHGGGGLRDGDPARAGVVAQAEPARAGAGAPPRGQPPPRGRLEDLHAIVLGVQDVDVAGAIGRQPADDADAPELGRVGVAAQLAQPRARTVEALHDRAVLVGHEDRARARGVRDGLREAQDARPRGGRLAQRRGLDVALRAGARARIAGREGGDDRGDGGDEQGTGHPRAVPVSSRPPPRRARCTESAPRRASRRSPAARPPGARRTPPRARAARAGRSRSRALPGPPRRRRDR